MQTLIIDFKGARLSLASGRVRIERGDERPAFVPIGCIRRLVILSKVEVETSLLGALAEQGVGVAILSPRDHRRTALVLPPFGGEHVMRLTQYRLAADPRFSCEAARLILRWKLQRQWRVLKCWRGSTQWRQALRAWPGLASRLRRASSLDELRGIEGGAAAMYFGAMREHLPASLGFAGRARRPPPDPVNAMLSLGYTLLHFEAVLAIHASGLDPCIGFLHAPEFNRESLACDFIEPLRPKVDAFVLNLFSRRILRSAHFSRQQGACRLGKAGRAIFYQHWETLAESCRRQLRRGCALLRGALADG